MKLLALVRAEKGSDEDGFGFGFEYDTLTSAQAHPHPYLATCISIMFLIGIIFLILACYG